MLEQPINRTINRVAHGLYEQDFYLWTQQMAAALQAGDLEELDWVNLAEEIAISYLPETSPLSIPDMLSIDYLVDSSGISQ